MTSKFKQTKTYAQRHADAAVNSNTRIKNIQIRNIASNPAKKVTLPKLKFMGEK